MADSFLWRPFPILTLTVRQFMGGKAVRVVVALSFIPAVFAAIYLINPDVTTPFDFLVDVIFLNLVAPTLLPITVLILATGALGNEVEDRTMPYLTLKPISRLRIVVEKLVGILLVAIPAVSAGLIVTFLMVARGDAGELTRLLVAILAGVAVGTVATAAIFMAVSLIIPRALLVGIIYAFVWESLLGRFLPGIRVVSVRHYAQSTFVDILNDSAVTVANAVSLRASLLTVGAATIVAVLFATWRLRRMNLE